MRIIFLMCNALFIFALPLISFPALFHISYLALLISGFLLLWKQKSLHLKTIFKDKEVIAALLFVGVVFLGGLFYIESFWEDKKGALWSARVFLQTFSLLILFKMIALRHEEVVNFVLYPIVASSCLLLCIGLYKFYFLSPSLFTYIDSQGELVSRFYIFDNPNLSAIFATISLGFILPFCNDSSSKTRYIVYFGVFILFLTLLYLGSRTGIMIFCILFVVYIWKLPYINKKLKWGSLLLGLAVLVTFFYFNIEVLMLKILYGQEIRPTIFRVGLEHYFKQGHYALGIGSGEFFKIDFLPFLGEDYKRIFHAHNLFLHFLIENGILGLGCYMMLWIFFIRRAWQKQYTTYCNPFGVKAFWLITLAHMIFSLSEATFFYRNAMWLILLVTIALEVLPMRMENE